MRIRQPKQQPPEPQRTRSGPWRQYTAHLVTPLYGGGVRAGRPDPDMPVRASSIRGQLRFWWRVLHPEASFAQEAALWGGLGESPRASSVWIRVGTPTWRGKTWPVEEAVQPSAEYECKPDGQYKVLPRFLWGIPDYALFPARGELSEDKKTIVEPPHEVLRAGLRFTLALRCTDPDRSGEVVEALRWWASFGGLGARTRRGLGSLRVEGLDPVAPGEVAKRGGMLVLGGPCGSGDADAPEAWKRAVDRMRMFRQGIDVGRDPGPGRSRWPEADSIPPHRSALPPVPPAGRSRWPEADSIRDLTGCHAFHHVPCHPARIAFPRAALGLPIVFHFKDFGDPPDTTLTPADHERMASPLILRAYWDGRHYRPACLRIPGALGYLDDLELRLKRQPPTAEWPLDRDRWWPSGAGSACDKAHQVPPMAEHGCDAIAAFLQFFKEGV